MGFPLMLSVSIFFKTGLDGALIVGGLSVIGLMGAYLIQLYWLKDRPVPALPPIAFAALIGYLITQIIY